ncbi:hypothetical protein [Streptomyces minutiscleroticus]|uniref:Uncharacterized protein n=1 Tax=Streptomyces minutiscleroticus TaxID=68238 RepID=A0A918NHV6_9ACTN|nr:hypothetical protein [Streptomyces minutiscleroticus]GGX74148.1 hypothetical protein GCM10010358_30650 [Streptomyces minutiscleroticus]
MGNPDGRGDEAARVSRLVGDLLIGLGEKVRAAGPEGVRILTDEELQRDRLDWFRAGWQEHGRATAAPAPPPRPHPGDGTPPEPPARLLRFPDRSPRDGEDHGDRDG